MARVYLNVSGKQFEFDSSILDNTKRGRLFDIVNDAIIEGKEPRFAIDRSSESFAAILTFYETGRLHLPTTVCPNLFLEDLEFWGVSLDNLTDCCTYRLYSFLDEIETRRHFKNDCIELNKKSLPNTKQSSCFNKVRRKIWAIVDCQESSIPAKLYYILIITMVMLSILSLALSTEPSMQRSLTKCEILEYLKHAEHSDYDNVKDHYNGTDCDDSETEYDEDIFDEGFEVDDGQGGTKTVTVEDLSVVSDIFSTFEIIFVVFFTVDILLRLFSCPNLAQYFFSLLNVIDILALTTSYVLLIVVNFEREHQYKESWLHILKYFQILRALRLLRVVKTFRASQVLAYSIKENMKDLLILGLFLFLGLSTFSCLIYFAESRSTISSIPEGWYWSIITLTTVGYGDITPKTPAGRVIASVCAVLGVILMAVTVPIFVNNFLSLYQYALVDEFIENRRKNIEKENDLGERKNDIGKDTERGTVSQRHENMVLFKDKTVDIPRKADEIITVSNSQEAWK